jgi:nitroreductase
MELKAVLKTRKSTRRFTGAGIKPAIVAEGLAFGRKAPSAGAMRAYQAIIVTDKDKIAQVSRMARQSWIQNAGLVVIICIEPEKSAKRYGQRGRTLYCVQDATLFGSHLDLFFVSQGLGTCWVGAFHENGIKKIFNLKLKPVSLLVVGHPIIS